VKVSLELSDEAATADAARALVGRLPDDCRGWTILLQGELGAGKSTFARAMLRAMGHAGAVPSPTYTLVEPYDIDGVPVYHVDLYRIGSEEELHYLGWDELDSGLRLVEWPDRAPGLAASADIRIALAYSGAGRHVDLEALSERARTVIGIQAGTGAPANPVGPKAD
jgi:tRNA threonylcarbamoyladenosine biosynthesis protein TsaE